MFAPFYFCLQKGYGEETIKRQLQAVAEGVAASVLQSPFPEKPTVFSGDHTDKQGAVIDPKLEVGGVYFFPSCYNSLWFEWLQIPFFALFRMR